MEEINSSLSDSYEADMSELIAKVVSSYEKIDEKIIYLLKTSSDDFLHLNGFFKSY
jgi:hypothetical protein